MSVDVTSEVVIARPVEEVSAFAADPSNAPRWYENIESVDRDESRPVEAGLRATFVAHFLGRRLEYAYELTELVPGERLVMRTAQGPFPMETTYTWDPTADGATLMTLRNQGEPRGFSKVAAPFLARAVRRANGKDLARLRTLLESG